jgi:hypothetical protein
VTIKRNLITVSAERTNNRRAKCPIVIDNMNDGPGGHLATQFLTHGRLATFYVRPVMQDPPHYIFLGVKNGRPNHVPYCTKGQYRSGQLGGKLAYQTNCGT